MSSDNGPGRARTLPVIVGGGDRRVQQRRLRSPAVVLLLFSLALLGGGTLVAALTWMPRWTVTCSAAALAGLGLAVAALARRRLVAVTVQGNSMYPTYRHGDRVIARRGVPVLAGQVVVVEQPAPEGGWPDPALTPEAGPRAVAGRRWMIKRVAAVPGDRLPRERVPALANEPGDAVPPGALVLLGDNRHASFDSRQIGYFPAARVLGAVVRPVARRRSRAV